LRWQRLEDQHLLDLSNIPDLRGLDLTGNKQLTDEGFRQLAKIKTLEKLVLSFTYIGDDGLEAFAKLDRLVHLDVSKTRITPAGLAFVKAALPKCHVVVDNA
jgi:hypothetical protein